MKVYALDPKHFHEKFAHKNFNRKYFYVRGGKRYIMQINNEAGCSYSEMICKSLGFVGHLGLLEIWTNEFPIFAILSKALTVLPFL